MKRFQVVVISIFFIFIAFSCSDNLNDGSSDSGTTDAFAEAMLAEVNIARTDPSNYAETRLKADYNAGTDNGAYEDLLNWESVPALSLNAALCLAADKHAKYMAENNDFGHEAGGTTPAQRCATEGYAEYSGENIAASSPVWMDGDSNPVTAATNFVLQLIIDDGVPDVGHRKNIMSDTHKVIGVGFHRDTSAEYDNYCVQDFGSQ